MTFSLLRVIFVEEQPFSPRSIHGAQVRMKLAIIYFLNALRQRRCESNVEGT